VLGCSVAGKLGEYATTRSDNTWTVEHSNVGAMQLESKGTVETLKVLGDFGGERQVRCFSL